MASNMSAAEHIAAATELMRAIDDPVVQAQETTATLDALRVANTELRGIRIGAVKTLSNLGWGYQQIADKCGISKPRVQQLVMEAKQVRRPGVIETQTRIAAGELRANGYDDEAIAAKLIPSIRAFRGGDKVTVKAIADMLDVPVAVVRPLVKSVDAALAAAEPAAKQPKGKRAK